MRLIALQEDTFMTTFHIKIRHTGRLMPLALRKQPTILGKTVGPWPDLHLFGYQSSQLAPLPLHTTFKSL